MLLSVSVCLCGPLLLLLGWPLFVLSGEGICLPSRPLQLDPSFQTPISPIYVLCPCCHSCVVAVDVVVVAVMVAVLYCCYGCGCCCGCSGCWCCYMHSCRCCCGCCCCCCCSPSGCGPPCGSDLSHITTCRFLVTPALTPCKWPIWNRGRIRGLPRGWPHTHHTPTSCRFSRGRSRGHKVVIRVTRVTTSAGSGGSASPMI